MFHEHFVCMTWNSTDLRIKKLDEHKMDKMNTIVSMAMITSTASYTKHNKIELCMSIFQKDSRNMI